MPEESKRDCRPWATPIACWPNFRATRKTELISACLRQKNAGWFLVEPED